MKLKLAGSMGVLLVLIAAFPVRAQEPEVSAVEVGQSLPFVPVANPLVREGNLAVVRVQLNGTAGSAGVRVNLTSSDTHVILPATEEIRPGNDSKILMVAVNWEATAGPVTISAARAGSSVVKQAVLTVRRVQVSSLTFTSASVPEGGGTTGTVILEADPSGGSG